MCKKVAKIFAKSTHPLTAYAVVGGKREVTLRSGRGDKKGEPPRNLATFLQSPQKAKITLSKI